MPQSMLVSGKRVFQITHLLGNTPWRNLSATRGENVSEYNLKTDLLEAMFVRLQLQVCALGSEEGRMHRWKPHLRRRQGKYCWDVQNHSHGWLASKEWEPHHSDEEAGNVDGDGKQDHAGASGQQQGVDHASERHGLVVVVRVGGP